MQTHHPRMVNSTHGIKPASQITQLSTLADRQRQAAASHGIRSTETPPPPTYGTCTYDMDILNMAYPLYTTKKYYTQQITYKNMPLCQGKCPNIKLKYGADKIIITSHDSCVNINSVPAPEPWGDDYHPFNYSGGN